MILQTIHKSTITRLFMGFLAIMMVFVTFETKANDLKGATYSGETFFKGIFFAEGPVAENIPILQGMSAKDFASSDKVRQEIDDFHASVINYVNSYYPSYLQNLKAAVESKSHTAISQRIEEGKQILEAAIDGLEVERDLEAEQNYKAALQDGIEKGMSLEEMKDIGSAKATELQASSEEHIVVCLFLPVVLYIYYIWFLPATSFTSENELFRDTVVSSLVKL